MVRVTALALLVTTSLVACAAKDGGESTGQAATAARTTLRVPLLDEVTGERLAAHNDALARKRNGARAFPEFLDMDVASIRGFHEMLDRVDAANDTLGTHLELRRQASPLDFGADTDRGLCYRGNGAEVPALLRDLNDSVFSEFVAVYMWKLGGETHRGAAFGSFGPEDEGAFPDSFKRFDGKGQDLMLVVSATEEGTERLALRIPKCHE